LARPEVRGSFSQSGPRRPAVVTRLARTLGGTFGHCSTQAVQFRCFHPCGSSRFSVSFIRSRCSTGQCKFTSFQHCSAHVLRRSRWQALRARRHESATVMPCKAPLRSPLAWLSGQVGHHRFVQGQLGRLSATLRLWVAFIRCTSSRQPGRLGWFLPCGVRGAAELRGSAGGASSVVQCGAFLVQPHDASNKSCAA
jgi:hypothetical protein